MRDASVIFSSPICMVASPPARVKKISAKNGPPYHFSIGPGPYTGFPNGGVGARPYWCTNFKQNGYICSIKYIATEIFFSKIFRFMQLK